VSTILTPAGGLSLILPNGLYWEDRGKWQATRQVVKPLLPDAGGSAAILIQETHLSAGRPITLVSTPNTGWATWGQVQLILALADNPTDMTLVYAGVSYSVRFRFENGSAVEWEPLWGPLTPNEWLDDVYCLLTLRLIET
jgi:hypothetical protein